MNLQLEAGQLFADDFRVVGLLSEGGMGTVYVVEQLRTGKRRALKIMNAGGSAGERRRRFEQEASISALIKSEHVVDVVSAGVDRATDTPWLVMELLEGEDLAALLAKPGAVSPAEACEILAQLFHALAAAHDIPIVHRDLKPENIFLAKARLAQQKFLVKVLDFGIAKLLTGDADTTGRVGTPMWMAPEQTSATVQLTPAADVWSLGLIAFQLLAGRCYWVTTTLPEATTGALLREMLLDPLASASDRSLAVGGRQVPEGFDAWFARCVVRAPTERFPNARAAWDALAPILAHTPPASPEDSDDLAYEDTDAAAVALRQPASPRVPTTRPDAPVSKTKGSNLLAFVKCLTAMRGKEVLEETYERVPRTVADGLRFGGIVSSGWYPVAWYTLLHRAAAEATGEGFGLAREIGRETTKVLFTGIYRVITYVLSPESIMARGPGTFSTFFDTGEARVLEARPGCVSAEFTGCRGFDRRLWEDLIGSIEMLGELAGAKGITVRTVSGGGDSPNMQIEFKWRMKG